MSQAPITLYTTAWCGYCQRARQLLDAKKLQYTEIDVEESPQRREEMVSRSQRHTVPQIFIGTRHIGGCDELFALERSGDLEQITQGD